LTHQIPQNDPVDAPSTGPEFRGSVSPAVTEF
jgi:hypothetical protein